VFVLFSASIQCSAHLDIGMTRDSWNDSWFESIRIANRNALSVR